MRESRRRAVAIRDDRRSTPLHQDHQEIKALLSEKDADRGAAGRRCPRSARTASAPQSLPEPGAERRPDRRRHDVTGSPDRLQSAQNENTIAVNPYNPLNLVAGANDYRVFNTRERNDASGWAYTTFDGGRTWTNVQLPHLTFQTGATGALRTWTPPATPLWRSARTTPSTTATSCSAGRCRRRRHRGRRDLVSLPRRRPALGRADDHPS